MRLPLPMRSAPLAVLADQRRSERRPTAVGALLRTQGPQFEPPSELFWLAVGLAPAPEPGFGKESARKRREPRRSLPNDPAHRRSIAATLSS
jgi:hypothetical protein